LACAKFLPSLPSGIRSNSWVGEKNRRCRDQFRKR
jgi:hypothetical protein